MYFDRLFALEKELKAHPDIVLESFNINPPLEEHKLANVKHDALRHLYAQANGFSLDWYAELSGEEPIQGRVRLAGYARDNDDLWDHFDENHEPRSAREKPSFIINDRSFPGCGSFYAYLNADGEVFFVASLDDIIDAKMNVAEYLDALFISRGLVTLHGALFTDRTGHQWTTDYERFCFSMETLFQDSTFRQSLFKYHRTP